MSAYDAIVVGSGAAGGWAAKTLGEGGASVLVLEAGRPVDPSADFPIPAPADWGMLGGIAARVYYRQHVQARCLAFLRRTRHFYVNDRDNPYTTPTDKPFLWIRGRQTGGRLHTWFRGASRKSPDAFFPSRRGVADADWPIGYDDLAPYYARVESFLGVLGAAEGLSQVPDGVFCGIPPLSAAEHLFSEQARGLLEGLHPVANRFLRFDSSRVPAAWRAALATGRVSLRNNAAVSEIVIDRDTGLARGVRFIDTLTGKGHTATARAVMLCASTIESVRILLNSKSPRFPGGIGASGTLGHYLSDQVIIRFVGQLGGRFADLPSLEDEARDPYDFSANGIYLPQFRNVGEPKGPFVGGYGIQCTLGRGATDFYMLAFGEMASRHENCIGLDSRKRDAWGIPVARIECAHSANETALIRDIKETVTELCHRLGLTLGGLGRDSDDIGSAGRVFNEHGAMHPGGAIHEIGGARMGNDPRRSVVDGHNRCWDVPNVLVTDGACFVSAGSQNHTLTIMALTVRASELLLTAWRRGDPV
jgi:choline dehydrogenase-like flavoprotein